MLLLPKNQIQIVINSLNDKEILAALHNNEGYLYWTKFQVSNLPNEFVSLSDLERFGINLVSGRAIRSSKKSMSI